MTVLLILAAIFGPSVAFVAYRLWITRGRSAEEERAIRRAERAITPHFDAYATRIAQLPIKGE
jgi:5-carboxymethyl-2-hydroxymuconate isomerase